MVHGKVSTTCRCYTYIDMSVEYRPRETHYKYGKVSAECRPSIDRLSVKNCLPIYRSTLDRHIDRHIDRYVGRVSADISVEYRPRETYSKHDPPLATLTEK